MPITASNHQRKFEIDLARVEALAGVFARGAKFGAAAEIDIAFVSRERMRALNADWRDIDRATDVLSFPFAGIDAGAGGTIAICPDYVHGLGASGADDLSGEIAELLAHGVLHLAGQDHDEDGFAGSPMERAQSRLLEKAPEAALAGLVRRHGAARPPARPTGAAKPAAPAKRKGR